MERLVRYFLQSALILITLGMSVQVSAQPEVVTNLPANSRNFNTVGDLVYFNAGNTLWRTDGTAEGTIDLRATTGFFNYSVVSIRGLAIFQRIETSELWRSDGTPEGTFLLASFGGMGTIHFVGQTKDYVFFRAFDDATGRELYRTDGTVEGTVLIKDLYPGRGSGAYAAAVLGDRLFFNGNDGATGQELWVTDGTEEGTALVKDVNPGLGDGIIVDDPIFVSGNVLFFPAYTEVAGNEPWVSDGTTSGTRMVDELIPGPEGYERIWYEFAHDGTVYFTTYLATFSETQRELWKTSGSPGTSKKLKEIGYHASAYDFKVFNDQVYFITSDQPNSTSDEVTAHFWKTDGTSEGTVSWYRFPDSEVSFFQEVNGHLMFSGNSQENPNPLYRSDGTASGTEEFISFKANSAYESGLLERIGLTKVGDFAFFADHDGAVDDGGNPVNGSEDYFHLFQTDGFTTESMRSKFGISTVGTDNITNLNSKVIFTTSDDFGGTVTNKHLWVYDPSNTTGRQASFTLVDADTDEDIQTIHEGDVITKPVNANFNIRYNPAGSPGSVVFEHQNNKVRTENAAPFALAGDRSGDYMTWTGATAGDHRIDATPYSEAGGKGTPGETLTIHFVIEDDAPTDECMASGTILREFWSGVPGNQVSEIPLNDAPSQTSQLSLFEGPTNAGINYGARIHGYICPPATGDYVFWIASNDHSELWLSTDEHPGNKVRVAYLTRATAPRQWNKFATQQSAPIRLTAGQRYYIMALHKQGVGTDNLAVGWQLPDGTFERPIPGNRLSPFDGTSAARIASDVENESGGKSLYSQIGIYPNPLPMGSAELTMSGYEGISERVETQVEIINLTGEIVYAERIRCGGDCGTYLMNFNEVLVPGVYMVNMKTNGTLFSKRLLVK